MESKAAAEAAVEAAKKAAKAAPVEIQSLSEDQADAATDAWVKSQGRAQLEEESKPQVFAPPPKRVRRRVRANRQDPNRRRHRRHETPRCPSPGCKERLSRCLAEDEVARARADGRKPKGRLPGSKLYGTDLCTACAKKQYEAMLLSPGAHAYYHEALAYRE